MAGENLVRLVVGANDADATAHLEALKRRLDEIGRKVETASVNVRGDKEAELALARVAMKLDSVGRKVESPRIKVDGIARAQVSLMGLDLALDKIGTKTGGTGRLAGVFGKLSGSLGEAGSSAAAAGSKFAALGAAAAVVAAPLVDMAAAVGSFALFAVPELMKVQQAMSETGKAGRKAWRDLSPGEQQVGVALRSLGAAFHGVQRAMQPLISGTLLLAANLGKDLMPALRVLAVSGARILQAFIGPFDRFARSGALTSLARSMGRLGEQAAQAFTPPLIQITQDLLRTLISLSPAGIRLTSAVLRLVAALLPLINAFSKVVSITIGPLVNSLTAVTAALSAVDHAGAYLAAHWSSIWSRIAGALRAAWGPISGVLNAIVGALDAVAGAAQSALGILGSVASAASGVSGFLGKIGGFFGLASGGIAGAASGGLHSGLRMVGERGRELVQLPAGSRVFNNAQTEQMMAGGGQPIVIEIHAPAGKTSLDPAFWTALQKGIRIRGGDPNIIQRKVAFVP